MKCVAKGVYPINNGKVSIGSMYLPRRVQYSTEAELFWQGVLLRKKKTPSGVSSFVVRFANCVRAIRFWRG